MSNRRLRNLFPAALVLTVLAFGGTGCAPFATYPPVHGSSTITNPSIAPIPELMARGVAVIHESELERNPERAGEPVTFNLPPHTPISVWQNVAQRIGDGRPKRAGDLNAVNIHQVRLRGNVAEVDTIHRPDGGLPALTTLHMKRKLSGWTLERTRRWAIPIEEPVAYYFDELDGTKAPGAGYYPGRGDSEGVVTSPIEEALQLRDDAQMESP